MSSNRKNQKASVARRPTQMNHRDPLLDERTKPSSQPIKGRINRKNETHYSDIAQATYVSDTTGSVTALNLIAEGNDNVNRLGRKALMRSVSVKGFVSLQSSNGFLPAQQARSLLVWDNASAGALPAITDILTAVNSSAFINPNNVERFTILHDTAYTLGVYCTSATQTAVDKCTLPVDMTVSVNSPTQYLGTAANIASVQNGALLLVTCGDNAASGTTPSFKLSTRVTFTDVL
jgi:hypothetical protein